MIPLSQSDFPGWGGLIASFDAKLGFQEGIHVMLHKYTFLKSCTYDSCLLDHVKQNEELWKDIIAFNQI